MNGIDSPIACSLTSAEFRAREATLLTQFRSVVVATEELADGYVFHLPADRGTIALLAELIAAERECCPFLRFEMQAEPNHGPVFLRVTGPVGVKHLLRTIFFKPEAPT